MYFISFIIVFMLYSDSVKVVNSYKGMFTNEIGKRERDQRRDKISCRVCSMVNWGLMKVYVETLFFNAVKGYIDIMVIVETF